MVKWTFANSVLIILPLKNENGKTSFWFWTEQWVKPLLEIFYKLVHSYQETEKLTTENNKDRWMNTTTTQKCNSSKCITLKSTKLIEHLPFPVFGMWIHAASRKECSKMFMYSCFFRSNEEQRREPSVIHTNDGAVECIQTGYSTVCQPFI